LGPAVAEVDSDDFDREFTFRKKFFASLNANPIDLLTKA
jgi:hypothetical protein